LGQGLGWKMDNSLIEIEFDAKTVAPEARVELEAPTLRFEVTESRLPRPMPPREVGAKAMFSESGRQLRIRGLPEGTYRLRIDGKAVATARARKWATGILLTRGPDFDQLERLREAIVEKNRLYF